MTSSMTGQYVIIRGWSWEPGWVTVVSLCCFCNVALIFATMKTFILQQVKCCHLSPFLSNCAEYFLSRSLSLSLFFFFFSCPWVFLCFPHHLLFIFGDHPRPHLSCRSSFSDSVYLRKWRSMVGLLSSLTYHICPDLSLLISAMGSQLLMKSQSVLWTVTWSWVKGVWTLVAAFLWCLLTFSFTGELGFGEGRLSLVFSCVLCFSYLKLYNHFLGHERLTNSSDEQFNCYTLHSYTHNIKGDLLCSLAAQ